MDTKTIGCVLGLAMIAGISAGIALGSDPKPAAKETKANGPFTCGTGPTDEMKSLAWMEGEWTVTTKYFAPDGKVYEGATEATIKPLFKGSFLEEHLAAPMGPTKNHLVGMRSYDRFKSVYRIVWFDEFITLADVYEGPATETGFVVSNVKSGTSSVWNGETMFTRISQIAGPDGDSFTILWDSSVDDGKTWTKASEYVYRRAAAKP